MFPLFLLAGCASVDLSPVQWGEEELAEYVRTERIAEVIENARNMGLDIEFLPPGAARRRKGAVAAITVDPETGIREGGSVRRFSLGYPSQEDR